MKIPWSPLLVISILSLVGGCKSEERVEVKTGETELNQSLAVSDDRDLISIILDSKGERLGLAISEFRRRVDQGEFDFGEALPAPRRDQLIPILIEEIEENEQSGEFDVTEFYGWNDPWWVLISLQANCMKPDKEEWRDWWLNDKSTIFWTYSSNNKEKKQNKAEMATPRKPSD